MAWACKSRCQVIVEHRGADHQCRNADAHSSSLCGSHQRSVAEGRKTKLVDGRVLNPEGQTVREFIRDSQKARKEAHRRRPRPKPQTPQNFKKFVPGLYVEPERETPDRLRELVRFFEVDCRGSVKDVLARLNMTEPEFAARMQVAREDHGL